MKTRKSDTYKKSYSIVAAAETLGQQQFIKHQKRHKLYIFWSRTILFVAFLALWQISANLGWIDKIYFSYKSEIVTIFEY